MFGRFGDLEITNDAFISRLLPKNFLDDFVAVAVSAIILMFDNMLLISPIQENPIRKESPLHTTNKMK